MKHVTTRHLLLTGLLAIAAVVPARADIVTDYVETFDNVDVSVSAFKPKGWGHHIYSNYYKATYTATPELVGQSLLVKQSYPNASGYDDYLVAPASSGRVTLRVKLAEDGGSVKFYKVTPSGSDFYKGEELTPDINPTLNGSFQEVGFSNLDPATRIGIRAHNVYIDDFKAASADVVLIKKLQVASMGLDSSVPAFTKSGSNYYISAGADNKYSVTFAVGLKNSGEVDFKVGDAGYTLSLSSGTDTLATVPIRQPLAAGQACDTLMTFALDAAAVNGSLTFRITENITDDYSWEKVNVIPYHAEFIMRSSESTSSYSKVNNGTTVDFGSSVAAVEEKLWIYNEGTAPLTLTVDVPEGFTSSINTGAVIEAGSHVPLTLTMPNSPLGVKNGVITFTGNDIDPFTLKLTGLTLDPTKWYQNFEQNELPADMVDTGSAWSFTSGTASVSANADSAMLVSPKLVVAAGDKLAIKIAKNGTSSYTTAGLRLYRSADRRNWEPMTAPDVASLGSTYQNFEITGAPAGEYYIAFTGSYISIDEIYGFSKATVAYDLVPVGESLPAQAQVNSACTASITLRNAGPALASDAYTVKLMVSGKVVATAASEAFAQGEQKTFAMSYTPHAVATDLPINIVVADAAGNQIASSSAGLLNVSEEVVRSEFVIGNPGTSTQNRTPVYGNGNFSWSDIIYPAAKVGLDAGSAITRIAFKANSTSEAAGHIKVWIENTDLTSPTSTWNDPEAEATKEFDWTFPVVSNEEAFVVDLSDKPFVYNGANLRIRVKAAMTSKAAINWYVDTSAGNAKYDYESTDYKSTSLYTANCPVAFVKIKADLPDVSGKITSKADGKPVADASVTLRSGDVEYYATSNAAGEYTVKPLKAIEGYTVNVEAQGFFPYSAPVEIADEAITHDVALSPAKDLYIPSAMLDATATVNHVYTASAVVRNVNATPFAAEAYKVRLTVDGAVVAEVPGVALEANNAAFDNAGSEKTFTLSYTPHEATETPVDARIEAVWSETSFASTPVKLTILPEITGGETMIGEPNGFTNQSPMFAYYEASISQTDYPAELINVPQGADIRKISFTGYYYSSYGKEFDTQVELWLAPAELTRAGEALFDTTAMTKVAEKAFHIANIGSSTEPVVILDFDLAEPYTYEGGPLRMVMLAQTPNGSQLYFERDSRYQTVYKTAQSKALLADKTTTDSNYMPVMTVGYDNYAEATGAVIDAADKSAIAGAEVTLTSGDVKYSAVTDAAGHYAIPVVQRTLNYVLTVSAEGYETYSADVADLSDPAEVQLTAVQVGIDAVGTDAEADSRTFDLQGRQVAPDSRGIVIRSGKKILRKK